MASSEAQQPTSLEKDNTANHKWQTKLLPFMIGMPTIAALFFFIVSLIQINNLNNLINQSHEIDLTSAMILLEENEKSPLTNDTKLEYARWKTLSTLEANALQLRHRQANALLMFSIWTRYLGFITGMILALVGSSFILGKLQEDESRLDADSKLWKLSITTASPGLILTLLGTILMLTTIVKNFVIEVEDNPTYTQLWLNPSSLETPSSDMPPPKPFPESDTPASNNLEPFPGSDTPTSD